MAETTFAHEWFTGPKLKHPLADPATAKVLLARHRGGDSVAVLTTITGWVRDLMALPDVALAERFAVLDQLDAHAKNHQINLVPEFLETARLRKLTESVLWTTCSDFWTTLGDAYQACLDAYQAAPRPHPGLDYLLPLLVGRIIRSLTRQYKWAVLRHQRVERKFWQDLGRTYLFAESREFATRRVAVYASRHGESSARTELLKILMLAVSGPDALTPIQQHIAERIIAHLGERFVLSVMPQTAGIFDFDLASGLPPTRNSQDKPTPLLVRHFGPGAANEGLKELTGYLRRTGALPPFINFGQPVEWAQISAVLNHLSRNWAASPVPRQGKRQDLATELTIVPCLIDSARWLTRLMDGGDIAAAAPAGAERWQACDVSAKGCGAIIPQHAGNWVAVGTLVGVHRASEAPYRMAIVRRISGDGHHQHRIGMEFVGDAAAAVALFPAAATAAADPQRHGETAVLVSRRPDPRGIIELLGRPDGIIGATGLQMRFRDRVYRLELDAVIEDTRGYRRTRYRLA
ncbi:MAG TPA: hypothetical protein VFH22_02800 [Rhodocyclaceae bacterium]|nr:hypothetical protein [Rhodocyclaceae bacterium]